MEFVKPQPKTPAPGREVDAYCGKCKLELAHVVVAMDGPRIVRVQCNTCHGIHAFRGGAPTKRAKPTTSTRKAERAPLTANEYGRLMEGRAISRAARYRPTHSFETNDVVNHESFGLGVVTDVLADKKIRVAFAAGIKVLVHGR